MIHSLSLHHFRSYDSKQVSLSPHVTVISGPNGSGKTNILEAIYVACRGASFRGSDHDLLQFDQPWWRLEVQQDDTKRTVQFDSQKTTGRKQFTINEVKRFRLGPQSKLPVVLFEPNDLRLLEGSPARRRAFIDAFIAQLEPSYSSYVSRYDRALKQRNNLLKTDHISPDELFVWDMTLCEAGAYVLSKRYHYIALLNTLLTTTYQSLSHTNDEITVSYHTATQNDDPATMQQRFLHELHKAHRRDIVVGYTSVGPHRDDVVFHLNKALASATASRGETRSMVLSLKLIEIEQVMHQAGTSPILLLDDVFSELDSARREALIKLDHSIQTIITTTDADSIKSTAKKHLTHITTAI